MMNSDQLEALTQQFIAQGNNYHRARMLAHEEIKATSKSQPQPEKAEGLTLHGKAVADIEAMPKDRTTILGKAKVVGSGPVVPRLPSGPWTEPADLPGVEQPFPGDVSYVEPVGEWHEQRASVARSSEPRPLADDRQGEGPSDDGRDGPSPHHRFKRRAE
jgi:hypothetical protein